MHQIWSDIIIESQLYQKQENVRGNANILVQRQPTFGTIFHLYVKKSELLNIFLWKLSNQVLFIYFYFFYFVDLFYFTFYLFIIYLDFSNYFFFIFFCKCQKRFYNNTYRAPQCASGAFLGSFCSLSVSFICLFARSNPGSASTDWSLLACTTAHN